MIIILFLISKLSELLRITFISKINHQHHIFYNLAMFVTPQQMNVPSKIGDFIIEKGSWDNFPARAPQNTWFLAHIFWNVSYNVISIKDRGFRVQAKANISKNSWVRKDCADKRLLRHEYGHYLICCLAALTFRKQANEFGRRAKDLKQYQQYCAKLLKEVITSHCKYERDYDKQTYHYLNEPQQQQWEEDFSKKFKHFEQEEEVLKKQIDFPLIKKQNSRANPRNTTASRKVQSKQKQNKSVTKNIPKIKKYVNTLINDYSKNNQK